MGDTLKNTTLAAAILLVTGRGWAADDEIIKVDGGRIPRVEIVEATYETIQYKAPRIRQTQRLGGGEVQDIRFSGSRALDAADTFKRQGNWPEAIDNFQKATVDPRTAEAGAFGAAEAMYGWHEATGTKGEDAVKALEAYLTAYREKKGFHVPHAVYLVGRASLSLGILNAAAKHFTDLSSFPGEYRKFLAELGKGEVALARKDAKSASSIFRQVLTRAKSANMVAIYRQAAALRGRSLVAEKRHREAIDFLENHVKASKGKQLVFDRYGAQAYNALGDAYAGRGGADDQWEALYRYLWTTVLFHNWRVECAEALYKAAQISRKVGETGDADRLLGILRTDYGGTVWAAKAK